MPRRDYLAPEGLGGRIVDLVKNLLWAVVWLGRWVIRLIKGRG